MRLSNPSTLKAFSAFGWPTVLPARGSVIGGGVGVYTDADVYWKFDADGRFEWAETSTTQTMISPDPIWGGAMGGGSSSSQDGGAGQFSF